MGQERAIGRVLGFWLEEIGPEGWYVSDPGIDEGCAEECGTLSAAAMLGGLGHWNTTPEGVLAHLILLDQIPRNIHRGTADAYGGDARARAVAKAAIRRGFDTAIEGVARQFYYLPLMHSETLPDQDRSVRFFLTRMPGTDDPAHLEHAIKHRDVIRRFSRFPSRNAALGRADRAEEIAYREAGGYMS